MCCDKFAPFASNVWYVTWAGVRGLLSRQCIVHSWSDLNLYVCIAVFLDKCVILTSYYKPIIGPSMFQIGFIGSSNNFKADHYRLIRKPMKYGNHE